MDNHSGVYLLIEREFLKTNENIYKIGYSIKPNLTRFKQYPNGSKLLLHIYTEYAKKCERDIINSFTINFKRRIDIGNEYFEGDYKQMRRIIMHIVDKIENNYLEPLSTDSKILPDTIGIFGSFIENLMECNKCAKDINLCNCVNKSKIKIKPIKTQCKYCRKSYIDICVRCICKVCNNRLFYDKCPTCLVKKYIEEYLIPVPKSSIKVITLKNHFDEIFNENIEIKSFFAALRNNGIADIKSDGYRCIKNFKINESIA